jgi:cytochrome c oxidase subunit 2
MIRRLACALIISICCIGCAGQQSALDAQGQQAVQLQHLITLMFITGAAVWLIVIAVLGAALLRRRTGRPNSPEIETKSERRLLGAVSSATVVTALVIIALTAASYRTTHEMSNSGSDALTLRVDGYQWWWEVTYLDAKPDQVFIAANEIHVPVGRNVRISLDAADVIHSFWVPNLAGKQDLVPGRTNEITLKAEHAGVYRGQCAEFCGLQHAHMAFIVVASEPAEFDAWLASQRRDAAAPSNAEQDRGRQVFLARGCAGCHTIRGTPAAGLTGPDLTHVASRQTIAAGLLDTTRGSLAAWVADPQTLKPGNNMPMVSLTADDLQDLSAYLASLQ